MSKSAEKPEVVQLPAERPVVAPARNRRAAAQRVREARDRLTSTSGTRPAFDHELLRQYAQTRLSASFVIMLLVVAPASLFGLLDGSDHGRRLDRSAMLVHPRRDDPQLQPLPRASRPRRPAPAPGACASCCSTCSTAWPGRRS